MFLLLYDSTIQCYSIIFWELVQQRNEKNIRFLKFILGNKFNKQISEQFSSLYFETRYNGLIENKRGLTVRSKLLSQYRELKKKLEQSDISSTKCLIIYAMLFVLCLLTVFRIVPYILTTVLTVLVLLWINRKLLKEIDFMLLLTFVCFFVLIFGFAGFTIFLSSRITMEIFEIIEVVFFLFNIDLSYNK